MTRLSNSKRPPLIRPETFAFCLLITCSLQIMENLLPKVPIFPWLRIGLAYWIILPFLLRYGVGQVIVLFFFRNLMTLIYGGQIFSSFFISTTAGILTLAMVGSLGRYLFIRDKISLYGLSILTACSFNICQLAVAYHLIVKHHDFYFQIAPILTWSLVSGCLIAFAISRSQGALINLFSKTYSFNPLEFQESRNRITTKIWVQSLVSLMVFISIFLLTSTVGQLALVIGLALINKPKNIKILLFAWPFYFYIIWLHLFRTDGVYIVGEWITREGLEACIYYTLRTTNLILCGQWLSKYITVLMEKLKYNRYLEGVCFALPLLPSIFGMSIALGRDLFHKVKNRDFENLLEPIMDRLEKEFIKFHTKESVPAA